MSKRVAGRELNHDNWDQEEEEEEAGTFQRATDDEIKGRVIKKAKRRNLDGDKKTNVFSGFAFSSTASSNPAENAFSFLTSKPAVDSSAASDSSAAKEVKPSFGFVFGSSSNKPVEESAAKPFGGFVFGKPKSDDDTKIEDVPEKAAENGVINGEEKKEKNNVDNYNSLSKFMSTVSTWTCQTCMVSNPQDKNTCVCCETKKPVSGSSADQATKTADGNNTKSSLSQFLTASGNWSCDTCMLSNTEEKIKCVACEMPKPKKENSKEKTKVNGGFNFAGTALEAKSSETKWTCDVCMIQNNPDAIKCLACETLKPGANISEDEPKASMTFGATGGFSFAGTALQANSAQSKQWTCDVCMIRNNEDLLKCLACETMKPGSTIKEKEKSPVQMSFGASGGFKFSGSTTDTNSSQPSAGGFTFGQAATSTPLPTPDGGGFKFGSGNGGFKFGSTEKDSKESTGGGFKFGSTEKDSKESAGEGFKFGSTGKDSKESTGGGFKFGSTEKDSKENAGGGFKFGSAEKDPKESAGGGFKFGSAEKDPKESAGGGFKFGSTGKDSKESAAGGGFKFETSDKSSDDESGEGEGLKFEFTKTSAKKTDNSSSVFKIGSESLTPSTPLGFKFGGQTNTSTGSVFGAPRGPFGTPAGDKTGHQTPSKLAAGSKKAEYLGQIKALNLQVTSLINKHIETNALVDLSPVFLDYQKHINNIRTKFEVQPKSQINVNGLPTTNGASEMSKQDDEKGDAGDEVFEHKEENSFFSTKCKLFLKKDNKYEEHGKGYVHLKKCGDTEDKTQLVIRSENALGTILLNIMVESARVDKVGDNNILLATVPNPPIPGEESGPATFLIRVKKELRDEMLNHLQKE